MFKNSFGSTTNYFSQEETKMKSPCITNAYGTMPTEYIGIPFNGEKLVYRKPVLKALKKAKASKELIKAVKAAKGDLKISRLLIEADQIDILVDCFNAIDSHTAVYDYIDGLYDNVFNAGKKACESIPIHDGQHISTVEEAKKILDDYADRVTYAAKETIKTAKVVHETKARIIIDKYNRACERKVQQLRLEMKRIEEEKARIEKRLEKYTC